MSSRKLPLTSIAAMGSGILTPRTSEVSICLNYHQLGMALSRKGFTFPAG